jgi:MFS family permease
VAAIRGCDIPSKTINVSAVFTLFAGRLIQSAASTVLWVVGFATLADNVPADELGKMYGFVTVAIGVGTSGGPLVAGILFDIGGYWVAWSSVLFVIVFDVILRCLMLERSREASVPVRAEPDGQDPEREALLPPSTDPEPQVSTQAVSEKTGIQFYLCLCGNGRFVGGVVSYFCYAVLTASFDTTLPLHVRDAFHWGSLPAGLLFAAFQGPAVLLSVPVGWLKDRVGTRYPTTVGFALLVPLMWLIGVPGDERFPWAYGEKIGSIIYSVSVTCIGVVICLLNGVGMMEATRKFFFFSFFWISLIGQ